VNESALGAIVAANKWTLSGAVVALPQDSAASAKGALEEIAYERTSPFLLSPSLPSSSHP